MEEIDLSAYRRDINWLGVPHRANEALHRLMAAGSAATEVVREGLLHDDPAVRVGCCKVLDHFMDEASVPALIANLTHPNEEVRCWAMHALACDKCKEGSCRPGEDEVIPIAARMLIEDGSRRVRQSAAGLVGESVHRSKAALPALQHARLHDPSPIVRKIAGWYLPGGPRYKALTPKISRTQPGKRVKAELVVVQD